jgi:rhamnulokinase
MMPDLFAWLFTGVRAAERTDASTTQLLDPRAGRWSDELCAALDLPRAILPDLIEPGTEVGPIRATVAAEVGLSRPLRLIAPGTHDTASAVAAVPAKTSAAPGAPPDWAYLSSGTWSLLGVEVPRPVITADTLRDNFTNEGGVAGTTRLLKNIMGLWLVQECRRQWARAGRDWSYDELVSAAAAAPAFAALVDPDHPSFLFPGDMPARLAAFCQATGQAPPQDEGGFVRCALESLALKYRWAIRRLDAALGTTIKSLHVVGGGCRNALLCQFTADACGIPVYAGPVEATAAGNVLLQMTARGALGSLAEGREVIARSFPVVTYAPRDVDAWDAAAGRFSGLLKVGALAS